ETFAGSRFPLAKMDHAFVSESGPTYAQGAQSRGKRIVEFVLDEEGNRIGGPTTLVEYRGTGFSTIVGLAAGPDGLYFTELYEDSGANGPTAIGARVFRVRYIGHEAGDYDRDNEVTGADFLNWQRTLGSAANLSADGDNSGVVDAGDLTVWGNAFANQAPALAASAAPATHAIEPQHDSFALAALAGVATEGRPSPTSFGSAMSGNDGNPVSEPRQDQQLTSAARVQIQDRAFGTPAIASGAPAGATVADGSPSDDFGWQASELDEVFASLYDDFFDSSY
ncbi:MAG TPA: hypothetical protein VF175_03965, partial [Lacipirellula sp.]